MAAAHSFYHSFPRKRKGETPEQRIGKGLGILKLIKEHGLILAPEVVSWKQPLQNGDVRELQQLQKRVCFTELREEELPAHAKRFGPFALEFEHTTLRHLGAVPVSYVPQTLGRGTASAAGATIVAQLFDSRYTMDQLQILRDTLNQVDVMASQGKAVAPDCTFNLNNVDDKGNIVEARQVPLRAVRDVLDYLSFRNAPFFLMRGVLNVMLSLFYPADDPINDEVLGYYRQREWRLVDGLELEGVRLSVPLTSEQKRDVCSIDPDFWGRVLAVQVPATHAKTFTRIDEAEVISSFNGQRIANLIKSVIVPKGALQDATAIFDGCTAEMKALDYEY